MTAKKEQQAITVIDETMLTVQSTKALSALRKREVEPKYVSTHPGRGGKVFSYVDHAHVSDTLLDAFGVWFSHDVVEAHVLDDASAYALVRLTMHEPVFDGETGQLLRTVDTTITEVGTSPSNAGGGTMDLSYRIASAASRGLVKCVARRFGYGLEFYRKSDYEEPTNETAWNLCYDFFYRAMNLRSKTENKRTAHRNALVAYLADHDMNNQNVLDRFEECYRLTSQFVDELKGKKVTTPKMEVEEVAKETSPTGDASPVMTIDEALQYPMPKAAKGLGIEKDEPMLDAYLRIKEHDVDTIRKMFAFMVADENGVFGDAALASQVILDHWDKLPELLHGDEEVAVAEEKADADDPFAGMLDF